MRKMCSLVWALQYFERISSVYVLSGLDLEACNSAPRPLHMGLT